jgi:two-component system chemotaxis response regulator CheY
MDGFETLQRLKALDAQARVIVITADIQAGSEERVLDLGAQALLSKPVKPDALQAAMEACLS